MFKKLRKNKKGFTLVEVIVVLVILAILAALMVPSMTGWIDKAKDQSVLVKARSALLAAQTLISEKYAESKTVAWDDIDADEFEALAGSAKSTTTVTLTGVEITELVYNDGAQTATYTVQSGQGSWAVTDNA